MLNIHSTQILFRGSLPSSIARLPWPSNHSHTPSGSLIYQGYLTKIQSTRFFYWEPNKTLPSFIGHAPGKVVRYPTAEGWLGGTMVV